jgi:hypothetical protein
MTNCEVRVATAEDLDRWFKGERPRYSSKSFVMEIDGELEALWGINFIKGEAICFSVLSDKAKAQKRAIVHGIRMLRKLLGEHKGVIAYATAGEKTAPGFIKHVGFRHIGKAFWGEEVYYYE